MQMFFKFNRTAWSSVNNKVTTIELPIIKCSGRFTCQLCMTLSIDKLKREGNNGHLCHTPLLIRLTLGVVLHLPVSMKILSVSYTHLDVYKRQVPFLVDFRVFLMVPHIRLNLCIFCVRHMSYCKTHYRPDIKNY